MFLKSLTISRRGKYGLSNDPKDPLEATIEIGNVHGETKLKLGEEAAKRLLAVVSEEMIASARTTADAMTASFIEANGIPALPAA